MEFVTLPNVSRMRIGARLVCTFHTPSLFQVELEKRRLRPKCRRTDGGTDRRTDEHHGNSATTRSNERIAR